MRELCILIPDVGVVLALEPEELGAKMLFALRQRREANTSFHPANLNEELWSPVPGYAAHPIYPRQRESEIDLAVTEAWAWLEAQGLVIPAAGINGEQGWRRLSRRARKFENEQEFANFSIARLLPKEVLHPRLAIKVWTAFMRGEFDVAVFQAMKAVEVAVRDAAEFSDADYGTDMIGRAFNDKNGPLRDPEALPAEQVALRNLFVGAHGFYKNPHSHRDVELNDPAQAIEIILLANNLLRIIDSRRRGKT